MIGETANFEIRERIGATNPGLPEKNYQFSIRGVSHRGKRGEEEKNRAPSMAKRSKGLVSRYYVEMELGFACRI